MKSLRKTFRSNRYKQRISLFRLKMRVLQNRNNGWVNKDIMIPLSRNQDGDPFFSYNVSRFLREHRSKINSRIWIKNANEFIRLLDQKVHVDASNPRYAHIYQGIDPIVHRVIERLEQFDPFFKYTKLRRTGSISSNVKVGLPHEADYTLEISHEKTLNDGKNLTGKIFIYMIKNIVEDNKHELIQGLVCWVIHGSHPHKRIGAVCLVMELTQSDSSLVGVTVDIVPVYRVTQTDETFNEKACAFLPKSLCDYAQRGKVYRLIDKDQCDTGLIENMMMKELPDDQKQVFRAVKFLFQNMVVYPFSSLHDFETSNYEIRLKLFGNKPAIKSYVLRVLFLHSLLYVKGTDAAQHLTGGVLALCLLDMLKQYIKIRFENNLTTPFIHHPLIKNRIEYIDYSFIVHVAGMMKRMEHQLESENAAETVDAINLLNDTCAFSDDE